MFKAQRLTALRRTHGLTQNALAKKAGIGQAVLWAIECGQTKNPQTNTVAAIAAALNCTVDELLSEEGE